MVVTTIPPLAANVDRASVSPSFWQLRTVTLLQLRPTQNSTVPWGSVGFLAKPDWVNVKKTETGAVAVAVRDVEEPLQVEVGQSDTRRRLHDDQEIAGGERGGRRAGRPAEAGLGRRHAGQARGQQGDPQRETNGCEALDQAVVS